MSKVAVITGGASGMGLGVSRAFAEKGWRVYIFDFNEKMGKEAEEGIKNATFIKVDVSSYESQSTAFDAVFRNEGRLDFVFANAGIWEKPDFYAEAAALPPPPVVFDCLDVNLYGVIKTAYLAQHYFLASPHKGKGAVLLLMSSLAGLYSMANIPLYAAAKAGVIHFMRSIAPPLHARHGIRVGAICPGGVRTPLLSDEVWSRFPPEVMTPLSMIVGTVEKVVEGGAMTDSAGKQVAAGQDWGLAVEVNIDKFYFREQVGFGDQVIAGMMGQPENSAL